MSSVINPLFIKPLLLRYCIMRMGLALIIEKVYPALQVYEVKDGGDGYQKEKRYQNVMY